MFNEPRNWKWMVPAALVAPLVGWWSSWFNTMNYSQQWMRAWSVVPMSLAVVCAFATMINLWKYVSDYWMNLFERRQQALNQTPLTLLADAMKQMHPETVRVLNRFGVKTSWGVRIDAKRGSRDWVLLDTDPSVHFSFIEFVLEHSTNTSLMSLRYLAEGSMKWDPDGMIEDREQYRSLQKWLFRRLMITMPFGNQPSQFLPPWTPELILDVMGLEGPQELEKPAEVNGMKDLGATKPSPLPTSPPNPSPKVEGSERRAMPVARGMEAPPVTDEEMLAIQEEERRYAEQYQS